ncbi:MAG: phosphatase PAP2 family protein [Nitrospirae bacterium]|nr:phosphatase PAP2 family protein [Nitrospirota bacterium]
MDKTGRNQWLVELVIVSILIIVSTIIFRHTNADIALEGRFYCEQCPDSKWLLEKNGALRFFYNYGSWPAAITVIGALVLLVLSYFKSALVRYRVYSIFLILALLIGPGFIINSVLKVHWGKPRPREVREFGGRWEYQKLFQKGESGRGKSFPCGHCSMGYFFFAFYFIFKNKRRRLAFLFLLFGMIYGSMIGFSRMALGGHFPSDVLWAAFIPFLVPLVLYYFVLNIPRKERCLNEAAPAVSWRKKLIVVGLGGILIILVLGALFLATPVYEEIHDQTNEGYLNGGQFSVDMHCSRCDLDLYLENGGGPAVAVSGTAQGFGFPTNKISHTLTETVRQGVPTVFFDLRHKGFFSELVNTIQVKLRKKRLAHLNITVDEGDVAVHDSTDAGLGKGLPESRLVITVKHGTLTIPRSFHGKNVMLNVPSGSLKYE